MKYLALFRDSLKEASDSKVLIVTVLLSVLLILALLTTSFTPATPTRSLGPTIGLMNWAYSMQAMQTGLEADRFEFEKYEERDDDKPYWQREYYFVVAFHSVEIPAKFAPGEGKRPAGQAKGNGEGGNLEVPRKEQPPQFQNPRDRLRELHIQAFRNEIHDSLWYLTVDVQEEDKVDKKGYVHRYLVTGRPRPNQNWYEWPHEIGLFFGLFPLSFFQFSLVYEVYWIEDILVNNIGGWFIVLIGVVVSSYLIPNMLQKGSVDLLLVRPISRPALLVFKYLGGLLFVFLNSALTIGGVWLAIGLKTGIWAPSFLISIFIITFFFAVLYAFSTYFAVLMKNSIVCILLTLLVWIIVFGIDKARWGVGQYEKLSSGGLAQIDGGALDNVKYVIDVAYAVLPRAGDMNNMTTALITNQLMSEEYRRQQNFKQMTIGEIATTLGVSLAYIVVLLGLACWRFSRQDY